MIYNGHGGNNTAVLKVLYRINHNTSATAVSLNTIVPFYEGLSEIIPNIDWHAGVAETSWMLYVANSLVDMSKAEKPILNFPPDVQKAREKSEQNKSLQEIAKAKLFTPKTTGKKASTREMTNNGVMSTGDPKEATVELGRKKVRRFVEAAVRFIEGWKKLDK